MSSIQILKQATKAAHLKKLSPKAPGQRFSEFPVHESDFWGAIFAMAEDIETAQEVINAMNIIENEPCVENERVYNCIQRARSIANLTLLN